MPRVFAIIAVFVASSVIVVADDAAIKLEGTWFVQEGTIGGKPDPKIKDITAVEFKDGVMSVKTASGADDAKFRLDSSKTPAEINLTTNRGNLTIAGIYKLETTAEGTELVIAFSQGDRGPRPKDFTGSGEKTVLLKLTRKKPVRD